MSQIRYHTDSNILCELLQRQDASAAIWQTTYHVFRGHFVSVFESQAAFGPEEALQLLEAAFAHLLLAIEERRVRADLTHSIFVHLLHAGQLVAREGFPNRPTSKPVDNHLRTTGSHLDGEVLMALLKQEEKGVFEAIYNAYRVSTQRFFSQKFGSMQVDVLEEFNNSMMNLKLNVQSGRIQPPLKSTLFNYFLTIARNNLLKHLKQGERLLLTDSQSTFEVADTLAENEYIDYILEITQARDISSLIDELFNGLGSRCQEILKWKFWEKLPVKTMASQLGVTENVVKVNTHRCLEQLQKTMQQRTKS